MTDRPLVHRAKSAFRQIGVGVTKGYELIAAGSLDARKVGTSTVITDESLQRYVALLPKAVVGQKAA